MSLFKKGARVAKLIQIVFGTDEAKELLDSWYKAEVTVNKYSDVPHIMAAKVARADFVLEIMRVANLPPQVLSDYTTEAIQADDEILIMDDDFFTTEGIE